MLNSISIMKKEMILLVLFVSFLLVSPILIIAQEPVQSQTYSGFNRFTDNIKLAFSREDNRVRLALEIREKEVYSAINNIQNQGEDKAIKNLERARNRLQIVQEEVSLDTSEEIKTSVDEITNEINQEENLPDEFEEYLLEEEKTQLTAELTEKTFEYCKALAQEDYSVMLKQEECNPDTAPKGLEKELKELKQIQEQSFNALMLDIRSCVDDPGTCSCEDNLDIAQKAKCEKMVALAVKCEYKDDEVACNELISMKPVKGDNFAESFVPDWLMDLFRKNEDMIGYNIEKSDVPPECYNENERVKTQCAAFREMKEISSKCWDDEGNFLLDECGGPKEDTPTMQESIPQCFDENNNFLEEKCGEITIIWNEEGLINYIIETEIENIIEEFENKSTQHTIDINKTDLQVDGGQVQVQNKVWEIKEEMNQINNQIVDITYADGTGPGGESGTVIEGDEQGVVTGDSDGEEDLTPEVETDVASGGHEDDNVIDEGDEGTNIIEENEGPIPGDTDEGNEVITNQIDE